MPASKSDIRQQMRQQRAALAPAMALSLSLQASKRVRTSAWYLRSHCIAGYMPAGNELDVRPVLAHALRRGARTCLPRLASQAGTMQFCEFNASSQLHANRLGIAEPEGPARRTETISLVLLPLLAFDSRGNRLGQGGGYYDRLLGNQSAWARPLLVGMAYDFQHLPSLPHDPWDVPLDAVVTPTRSYVFSARLRAEG